jgi:hypothetical protein
VGFPNINFLVLAIGSACLAYDFHAAPPSVIFQQFIRENKNKITFAFDKAGQLFKLKSIVFFIKTIYKNTYKCL